MQVPVRETERIIAFFPMASAIRHCFSVKSVA
jgi:hypothetical protein